jgi:hypothetical protein
VRDPIADGQILQSELLSHRLHRDVSHLAEQKILRVEGRRRIVLQSWNDVLR